jgi:hypothetical protein
MLKEQPEAEEALNMNPEIDFDSLTPISLVAKSISISPIRWTSCLSCNLSILARELLALSMADGVSLAQFRFLVRISYPSLPTGSIHTNGYH